MVTKPLREVCFVIGRDGDVLWSDEGSSATSLPDSRSRWEAIWSLRDTLDAIAHSHPVGPLAFSAEDESTMEAVEDALGRPIRWIVVAPAGAIARLSGLTQRMTDEPPWIAALRAASGMPSARGA